MFREDVAESADEFAQTSQVHRFRIGRQCRSGRARNGMRLGRIRWNVIAARLVDGCPEEPLPETRTVCIDAVTERLAGVGKAEGLFPFGVTRPAGGFGPAALPSMGSRRRTSIPSTACLDQFLEAAEVHEEMAVHANAGGFLQGADGARGTALLECPVEHRDVRDGLRRHTGPPSRGTAGRRTEVRAWRRAAGTTMTRMRGDGRLC
ncbi:hypothetical protein [Streptomyces prasinus]|uniref:hypothetical protein n=1 Tax=Streptomyces prasinus TaxID=67345 RepID=UPI0033B4572C